MHLLDAPVHPVPKLLCALVLVVLLVNYTYDQYYVCKQRVRDTVPFHF